MKEHEVFRIGIVGIGNIAGVHAQAIQNIPIARLHSVYSRDIHKATTLADKYGAVAFDEWDNFIQQPELDIVIICTPSGTHLDYGQKCALAGKNVIVEKPIEVTLQKAEELVQICRQMKVHLAVIYQNRFLPAVIKMKKLIDQNTIGKIILANAFVKWYRDQDYYDSTDWRGTLNIDGGGVLINQAIHTLDLLIWMAGDVESVSGVTATLTHQRIEGEDNAVAAIRFQNGALGVIQASTSVVPPVPSILEIHGETGSLFLQGNVLKIVNKNKIEIFPPEKKGNISTAGVSSPLQGFPIQPHEDQLKAIIKAISENKQPPVSGAESIKSLRLVLDVYNSAKSNVRY